MTTAVLDRKQITPFCLTASSQQIGAAAAGVSALVFASTSATLAAGTVPEDVKTGIDNSIATVQALSPLALACLVVALTPWASMLTLRFINMVLSRV